jgi:hypothetical protein
MFKEVTIERGLRMPEADTEGWESHLRGADALLVNQVRAGFEPKRAHEPK